MNRRETLHRLLSATAIALASPHLLALDIFSPQQSLGETVSPPQTVYFHPYGGNITALYDGSTWRTYTFAEISIKVPDAS